MSEVKEDHTKAYITRSTLASKLKAISSEIETENLLEIFQESRTGRKPITAYRNRSELILAQAAPNAALVQRAMIRGEIPGNDIIFRVCEAVLDRVCGKARQKVEFMANEEHLERMERYAAAMERIRNNEVLQIEGGDNV